MHLVLLALMEDRVPRVLEVKFLKLEDYHALLRLLIV